MIATSPSDDIQALIDFLRQAAGRDSMLDCQGASPEEVARFAQLVRRPIPHLYLGYLREFGRKDGPVKLGYNDADPTIGPLLEYYDRLSRRVDLATARDVMIAVNGLAGDLVLRYPDASMTGESEPRVVLLLDETEKTCAIAFRNFLYQKVIALRTLKENIRFDLERPGDRFMIDVAALAEIMNFQGYWFNDDWTGWFERDDGSILYLSQDEESIAVRGYFLEKNAHDAVRAALTAHGGLLLPEQVRAARQISKTTMP